MNQKQKMMHLNGLIKDLVEAREDCCDGIDGLRVMMVEAEIHWFCALISKSEHTVMLFKEYKEMQENYNVAKAEKVVY